MDLYIESGPEEARERGNAAPEDEVQALRRSLDEALARVEALEERLDREVRERAELVHLVSHELRTPITVISGFGRLLQNEAHGSLNKEQTHYIDQSLKACRRLDQFVRDLLEARPESASALPVEIALADLHETIRGQLESLSPLLEERGIEVDLVLAARAVQLPFDARRIEQVMTNLVTNAIRYGRAGGRIRISTRSIDEPAPGSVEVAVEDDGPGIPVEDRERLFAPFVRGGGKKDSDGLGIGLAICRRIIAAHGGSIRVEASPLGGARFVFSLSARAKRNGRD